MRKNIKRIIILILILFISIGFAVLTSNLSINSTFNFRENSFNIYFSNINVLDTSTVTSPTATITNDTTINYSGTFNVPGDFIEFSFFIVNDGTIDGQINQINTNLTTEQLNYISYNLKYDIDNTNVNTNDIIYAGQKRKVIAHFEYKEDIEEFIDLSSLNLNLTMKFIQPQTVTTTVWNYEYSGDAQYYIVPKSGTYKIELWGASGGSGTSGNKVFTGGNGAYTSGNINLVKSTKMYLYVGELGSKTPTEKSASPIAFNGGGSGSVGAGKGFGTSGGGATDIRLDSTLNSRIMVAAGGGGVSYYTSGSYSSDGGAGGGLIGIDGHHSDPTACGKGGTQLALGASGTRNAGTTQFGGFGLGSSAKTKSDGSYVHSGGGAGGYWGGGAGSGAGGPGGGGSSYISGHTGCIAVESATSTSPRLGTNDAACTTGTTDIQCSYHYLNDYKFTNTIMIDGDGYQWTTEKGSDIVGMPTHNGTGTMTGNIGNGFIKITYIN